MIQFGEPETWKQTVDQFAENKDKTAALLDNTSLGAYYDFLDAGGQLNYEDFLQYQSIPQSDRPLTGQTPTQQLFGIQRQNLKKAGFVFNGQTYNVDIPNLTSVQIDAFQKGLDNLKNWSTNPTPENWIEVFRNPSKTGQTHQSDFSKNLRNYVQGKGVSPRNKKLFDAVNIKNLLGENLNSVKNFTAQKFRAVSNIPKSQKAAQIALGKSMKAVNAVRDVFVIDPDADLEDVTRGVFGKKFDEANLIQKTKMLDQASQDVAKFLEAVSTNRKVKGFKPMSSDKLGDIIQNIEDNTSDFKFREGTLREYKYRVRDSLLKIQTDSGQGFRNLKNVVGKSSIKPGQVIDEVFGLSATYENAPGYTENIQLIDRKINNMKGKQIDKPFKYILQAIKDNKETVQYKGNKLPISEAIKRFNLDSKMFGKKYNISTPNVLIGKNLNAEKLVQNFANYSKEAQQNILELANKGVVLTATKPSTPIRTFITKGKSGPTLGANLGLLKGLGTALEVAGTPLAALGFAGSEYLRGRKEGKSRFEAATDPYVGLSLVAPNLISKIRPGVMRGVLGLGRAARFFTPTGIGLTLAGELKKSYDDYQRVQAMKEEDPEQYKKFMQTRVTDPLLEEEFRAIEEIGAREGAMGGGIMRLGYADGPEDPKFKSRRNFMKGVASLLALAPFGVGKLFRQEPVQKAVTKVAEVAPQSWSWVKDNFWTVYNKIKSEGNLTKVEKKGVEVNQYKNYEVIEDPNQIRIRYETDRGNKAETVYNKPTYEVDPETGKAAKVPGEFEEFQDVYRSDGKDIYRDFEEEIIDPIEGIKDVFKKD